MRTGTTPAEAQQPARRVDVVELAWSFFASTRLALALILAIAVASLVGTLVMQAPSEVLGNPDAVRTWVERARPKYGGWSDLLQTAGAFWIFQTVGFRLLFGLLAVNIVICTANRLPRIWRQVFTPPARPGEALFERGKPRETVLMPGLSLDSATVAVRRALRWRRFRVTAGVEPHTVYLDAERNRFTHFGTLLTHLALVLVLVAAVLRGPLGAIEEPAFAVPVGSTREVGHDTGLALAVEDFADEYQPDGRPKDYRSEVILYERGREVARGTIRVNEPLAYGGVRFHQSYFGQSAVVSVADKEGKVIFRDAVALTWRSNDGERPVGYFSLPSRDLHIYLVGTAGETDRAIRPGELLVEAYQGRVTQPTHRVMLTQRRPLSVAELQFVFEREIPFTGLRVVRDPSASIVWVASTLMVAGLLTTFYLRHRRLWVRLRSEPAGILVTLVGAGRETAEELRRIADQLETPRREQTGSRSKVQGPRLGDALSTVDRVLGSWRFGCSAGHPRRPRQPKISAVAGRDLAASRPAQRRSRGH